MILNEKLVRESKSRTVPRAFGHVPFVRRVRSPALSVLQ